MSTYLVLDISAGKLPCYFFLPLLPFLGVVFFEVVFFDAVFFEVVFFEVVFFFCVFAVGFLLGCFFFSGFFVGFFVLFAEATVFFSCAFPEVASGVAALICFILSDMNTLATIRPQAGQEEIFSPFNILEITEVGICM